MRRRRLAYLPLGLFLLTIAEIVAFFAVVKWAGALWAVLALVVASTAGLILLRREGIRGWRAFRAAADAGRPPGEQVTNSLVGLLGALLLAVPGFVSSLAGLLLVLPPVRVLARHVARRAAERHVSSTVAGDLFGPRRVKVHPGAPRHTEPAAPAPVAERPAEIVEGEIVS